MILTQTPVNNWPGRLVALGVFIVIVATDMLDGYLARRWNVISSYGKVVDPVADKALVTFTMVGLYMSTPSLQNWLAWLIFIATIAREVIVAIAREIKQDRKQLVVPANTDGKIKMTLQSLGLMVAFLPSQQFAAIALALMSLSLFFAARSGYAYVQAR